MANTKSNRTLSVHMLTSEGESLTAENQLLEMSSGNQTYVVAQEGALAGIQITLLKEETRYVKVAFNGVVIFHGRVQGEIPLSLYSYHYAGLEDPLRFEKVTKETGWGYVSVDFFISGQKPETLFVGYVNSPLV